MASHPRPTSPHLQIYRPQLTSFLSILHRIAGVFLSIGILALIYWLVAAASSAEAFDQAQSLAASIVGRSLLFLWTGAFFYHLLNGARHMTWDTGHGLERKSARLSGWIVFLGAIATTALFWALVLRHTGGAA